MPTSITFWISVNPNPKCFLSLLGNESKEIILFIVHCPYNLKSN